MAVMTTVLGLFGMALFIVCTITVAAAITWTVVKLTSSKAQNKSQSS
jgi:hypothetical protein